MGSGWLEVPRLWCASHFYVQQLRRHAAFWGEQPASCPKVSGSLPCPLNTPGLFTLKGFGAGLPKTIHRVTKSLREFYIIISPGSVIKNNQPPPRFPVQFLCSMSCSSINKSYFSWWGMCKFRLVAEYKPWLFIKEKAGCCWDNINIWMAWTRAPDPGGSVRKMDKTSGERGCWVGFKA